MAKIRTAFQLRRSGSMLRGVVVGKKSGRGQTARLHLYNMLGMIEI